MFLTAPAPLNHNETPTQHYVKQHIPRCTWHTICSSPCWTCAHKKLMSHILSFCWQCRFIDLPNTSMSPLSIVVHANDPCCSGSAVMHVNRFITRAASSVVAEILLLGNPEVWQLWTLFCVRRSRAMSKRCHVYERSLPHRAAAGAVGWCCAPAPAARRCLRSVA